MPARDMRGEESCPSRRRSPSVFAGAHATDASSRLPQFHLRLQCSRTYDSGSNHHQRPKRHWASLSGCCSGGGGGRSGDGNRNSEHEPMPALTFGMHFMSILLQSQTQSLLFSFSCISLALLSAERPVICAESA